MKYIFTRDWEGKIDGDVVDTDNTDLTVETVASLLADGTLVEEYSGEMARYKVLQEYPFFDEFGNQTGANQPGEIISLPVEIGKNAVENGFLELCSDELPSTPTIDAAPDSSVEKPVETVDPIVEEPKKSVLRYKDGQEVISDGYRTVNDKEYRHIRLADGSYMDLTEEEYSERVKEVLE